MNNKILLYTLISIVCLILCLAGSYFYFKDGFIEKGKKIGYDEGFNTGYNSGKTKGEIETKQIIETALKGASILLADKYYNTEIPYQSIVNGLDTASLHVSTQISNYVDTTYKVVIHRLSKAGNFSQTEITEVLNNYDKIRKTLAKEVLNDYSKRIIELEKIHLSKKSILNKTDAYTSSVSSNLCTIIGLFSPLERYKIAEAILKIGNDRNLNEFGKVKITITREAVNYVSEQLCSLILENSFEFIIKLFLEYATIINFTEEFLIVDQNIEQVMKLVTAELNTSSYRTVTFERDWAVDPNYTIQTNSKVIAGIDLEEFFKVEFYRKEISNSGKTQIIITLPEPKILSIYPLIDPRHENFIWGKKLEDHEIRRLYLEEIEIARKQAFEKGIIGEAKISTEKAFKLLYSPLLLNSIDNYELIINFDNSIYNNEKKVILN